MYLKTRTWAIISLLCFLGAIYFWRLGNERAARKQRPAEPSATNTITNAAFPLLSTQANIATPQATQPGTASDTNAPFPYRIRNTDAKIDELIHSDAAILLRNALVDSASGVPLPIPPHLRSQGDPGSYIVQARGAASDAFRAQLEAAGAAIVSYVPNNAYLVRATAAAVNQLRASPLTQAVLPWEPYFKLAPKLLELAVEQKPLPDGNPLVVLVFPGEADAARRQLSGLGASVMRSDRSPFGTQLLIHAPADQLVALAQIDVVQSIEPAYRRQLANDLARTRVGISTNTITAQNHLNLDGTGIRVGVNDTGVDQAHPDLMPRVLVDAPPTGIDINGHGTHVAGIIASTGMSAPPGERVPGSTTNASFRGMAPAAQIFAQPIDIISGPLKPDSELQETTATNGVFVSNNSWGYLGAFDYTSASAIWDAAVRDSVPGTPGSQAITYVFSAGNFGRGEEDGSGGFANSLTAPATAKNVISVGATEQFRNLTNEIVIMVGTNSVTNTPFLGITDSDDEVIRFSSRGNVGPGIEGPFGRFKPDVVAPGGFLVSTRASGWTGNLLVRVAPAYLTDEVIPVGSTNLYFFFAGQDAIEARVRVIPNRRSPIPFPETPIYVRRGSPPPPSDFIATNNAIFPVVANDLYYFGIGNNFNQDLHCDIQVLVLSTNPPTVGDQQLVTLNADLEPYYRYESGTSMAAPVVSGMLALMQQQLALSGLTNPSPALMKALLINGARSLPDYTVNLNRIGNAQGWGMANITNSLPGYAAMQPSPTQWPVRFFDQETNALVTGQSHTRTITFTTNTSELRISLVWTDPPGNPSVGVKLVNDLDLIVTNLSTLNRTNPEVFIGNLISGDYSAVANADPLPFDVINNVENVFIRNPTGSSYSITVRARRVNVNAVTAHNPSGIAQDYALVISAGNPGAAPAFTVNQATTVAQDNTPFVLALSNSVPVFQSRIGANPQLAPSTNGLNTQWRFFEFNNIGATNTNVAFFAFLTPNLSRVRTSEEADIDLYVSFDSSLTNLDPMAIQNSFTSKKRGGTEAVVFTNAPVNTTYYVGIKSEDQQAATFGLFGFAGPNPFSQRDTNGNVIVNGLGVPVPIPDGSSEEASGALVFAYCLEQIEIRNVVVTNTLTHEHGGDLFGLLQHDGRQSVLNNHRDFVGTVEFIYDDSDSGQILASIPTDPPGTLRNFWGQEGQGAWQLTMIDSALVSTGRIETLTIRLEPRRNTNDTDSVTAVIQPNRWYYEFFNVPVDAERVEIIAVPDNGIVELYVRRNGVPDQTIFDYSATIGPGGGALNITTTDSPPLSPGLHFLGLFNPNSTPLTVNLTIRIYRTPGGVQPIVYQSVGITNILDDAVTTSLINVTNNRDIFDVRVGVRIDHDRASDLVLSLISPAGTRILLAENRGGNSRLGYGGGGLAGGLVYTMFTDDTNLTLTPIKFGTPPFTNSPCPTNIMAPTPLALSDGFEFNAQCGPGHQPGTVLSGWLVEGGDVDIMCPTQGFYGLPPEGAQAMDLNGFVGPGVISRYFRTAAMRPYDLRFYYCKNPNPLFPNFVADMDVELDGMVITNLTDGQTHTYQNVNWFTNVTRFVAPTTNTQLRFRSRNTGWASMYLDGITVAAVGGSSNGCNFFFPEEPLRLLQGENAFGPWRLEIWDNRVGAPLQAQLLSWRLEFDLVNTNPPVILLTNGQCYTGIVENSNVVRFAVRTPVVATAATNLLTSTGNMLLTARMTTPAIGTVPPDDYGVASGTPLEITTSDTPPLMPGLNYYLAVRNNDPAETNSFTLCVNFDRDNTNNLSTIIAITNGQCIRTNIAATNLLTYYQFDASSNAIEVTFELTNLTDNVDMVISKGLPLPNPTTFFRRSAQPGTNDEIITVTDYSFTLLPGRWYIGVYNSTNVPVTYTICARETVGPRYTDLTPYACTNQVTIGSNAVHYYQYTMPPNAVAALFSLTNLSGNVDLYVNGPPPYPQPGPTNNIGSSTNPGATDDLFVLSAVSTPPLTPLTTYYIAVTNLEPVDVVYDLCVRVFTAVPLPNAFCVTNTLVHSNDAHFFTFDIASNSVRADFLTLDATGNVDLYVSQFPFPGPVMFDYASELLGTTNEVIVIDTNSVPIPLAPGLWYATVVLRDPAPVTYCIKAVQYPVLDPFNIRLFITNGLPARVDLGWSAFDFMQFHLEYSDTLSPPAWQPFSSNGVPLVFGPIGNNRVITSFWHRDDGSLTPPGLPAFRAYRLRILP